MSDPGRQLKLKREGDHQPRAVIRIYGEESVEAMNEIANVLERRPSWIVQDWIAQVHAQLVDEGKIKPKGDSNE